MIFVWDFITQNSDLQSFPSNYENSLLVCTLIRSCLAVFAEDNAVEEVVRRSYKVTVVVAWWPSDEWTRGGLRSSLREIAGRVRKSRRPRVGASLPAVGVHARVWEGRESPVGGWRVLDRWIALRFNGRD
ncbi:hypothetical protein V6N11_081877 [Hibiscus sabdariffa]|uniref:Uncharacterized protein n=1 Tax=Hibiscus sabdariffa TaxID=183260 RepID=A0ABR2Q7G8_9ROSI